MHDFNWFDRVPFNWATKHASTVSEVGAGAEVCNIAQEVFDSGSGADTPVLLDGLQNVNTIGTSTDAKATAHPHAHTMLGLPDALVLLYQDGNSIEMSFSNDQGASWTTPVTVAARASFYPAAIANLSTQDIHLVYSKAGDPALGAGESVYYRVLTYIGSPGLPSWSIGGEVEIGFGTTSVGYANAVISAEQDGKLQVACMRKTATTRTWAQLTAQAAWSMAGAAENGVLVAASSGDRASMVQIGGYTYLLIMSGGSYILYQSDAVSWGDDSVTYTSIAQWLGDDNEGFSLCGEFLTDTDVAAVYVKDNQLYFRKYDPDGTVLTAETCIWPHPTVHSASLSWVGDYYRAVCIVDGTSATNRMVVWASEADWGLWRAYIIDTSDEEWDWVTTPQTNLSAPNFIAGWCQTDAPAYNVYAGAYPMILTRLITETGSGAEVVVIGLALTDSGAGAELARIGLAMTDAGAGAELVTISILVEEDGEGAELVLMSYPVSDVGAGAETAAIGITQTDAGVGAETVRPGPKVSDSGTGTDSIVSLEITVLEVGSGADVFTLNIPVTDAGAGSETALIGITMTEAGAGGEVVIISLNVTDVGVGADLAWPGRVVSDTGVGVDEIAQLAILATDSGSGAELTNIGIVVSDTGTGAEAVTRAVLAGLLMLRLMLEKGRVRLRVKGPGA